MIFLALLYIVGCEGPSSDKAAGKPTQKSAVASEKQPGPAPIAYDVLHEIPNGANRIAVMVLVSGKSSKEDVLALGGYLKAKYPDKDRLSIGIFDSEDVAYHVADPEYPEDEKLKHYLVLVDVNRKAGRDEIRWMAKGRGH